MGHQYISERLKRMMKSVAVALMLATCTLGAPQERKGLSEDEIRELTTKGETPLEVALRCGLFFAGEIGAPPIERLFVFNATWEHRSAQPRNLCQDSHNSAPPSGRSSSRAWTMRNPASTRRGPLRGRGWEMTSATSC